MSSKKLDHIIQDLKSEKLEDIFIDCDLSQEVQQKNLYRLQEGISAIDIAVKKVEEILFDYASKIDSGDNIENEMTDFSSYCARTETILEQALDLKVLLEARSRAVTRTNPLTPSINTGNPTARGDQVRTKTVDLPPIPIPSFGGNIWEWDNFWEIFNHNIHSQEIPDLVKFNYLLKALKGEARESVSKFQITADNYLRAVNFLVMKYNDKDTLVNYLIEKLDTCTARTCSAKDQRSLLEQLQTVVTQLQQKGEHVDNSWLIKMVIAKFPEATRRKVIARRQSLQVNAPFTMELLFKYLEEVLSTEEMILRYTDKAPTLHSTLNSPKNGRSQVRKASCMYCREQHTSNNCTKYATPRERAKYLRDNQLCAICASAAHRTTDCKGRMCFSCNGAHHTSCCFSSKSNSPLSKTSSQKPTAQETKAVGPAMSQENPSGASKKGSPPKIRSNAVTTSDDNSLDAAAEQPTEELMHGPTLSSQTVLNAQFSSRSHLSTGKITVMNPRTRSLTKIDVLLDTGAEVSFVSNAMAQELELPVLEERRIRLSTFGSAETKERLCKLVRMEAWDSDGNPHTLELLTYDMLTHPFEQPHLSKEDQAFIESTRIPVYPNNTKTLLNPLVLLGCYLLWSFIRNDTPMVQLPSGLHVLPTKIGYLVAGKTRNIEVTACQITQEWPDEINDIDQWEAKWSMNTVKVFTVHSNDPEISQEEKEQWENYWAMDKTGSEQFLGSQKEVQEALDRTIWDNFNSTIERRQDGYYVRLPWKDSHPSLPDNRALAYKRLVNVWNSLKEKGVVEQYDAIFQEQMEKNIVELVDECEAKTGLPIHYIPHQPVITPQKTTTKLRIVFDASAHYKGSPSLNDSLYRGPVILPPLQEVLLRFRVGTIALVSDVEKAFLQVRLHEADRDATRCIWLQDPARPPTDDNLKVLRFTRVTFGIKSSPFLLAGTLHYHLDKYKKEPFAQQIKQNLYVDNLLFTTNSLEESIQYYRQSKKIFRDMNMNLREFISNNTHVMTAIENSDKTETTNPKVLGVRWNTKGDTLTALCSLPDVLPVTKRSVTSAIATVYDPMGWFIPIMHPARRFLQSLWKSEYGWNTNLAEDTLREWHKIRSNSDGFVKTLPRLLAAKMSSINLVTFADASSGGMTACTYVCKQGAANLLMAKAKLPSIHSKTTIPKLELNAMTLAMRLTNFAITSLESVTMIQEVYLFTDSKIVLGWLKSKPSRDFGQFVYNRLEEIRRIVNHLAGKGKTVQFGYVASEENPADCGTRGTTKEDFTGHFWWTGPPWLLKDSASWPARSELFKHPQDEEDVEITSNPHASKRIFTIGSCEYDPELIEKGQARTFTQAKRAVAYAIRFIRTTVSRINARIENKIILPLLDNHSNWPPPRYLSAKEIQKAGKIIIRAHQSLKITRDIIRSLKDFNIRPDPDGLLRCHGRLGRSQLRFDAKYPIFILQKTILAELLICEFHDQGHPGINHTISLVRQEFWIPQLRSQVQHIVRRCLKCQKLNNLPYKYPNQDDLPKERVIRSRPFEHVGLDYFGPLTIREGNERPAKCYGVIITCAVTRLLHLDVVSDLSTVTFLHMMRRFFARRGLPRTIICDNAPTFTLGETILSDSIQAAQNDPMVHREMSNKGIEWRHITPYAPWQGGFYERMVKSVKHSLYKTLATTMVTFEELSTVIIEIETDFDSSQILRPIDFLQRDICIAAPTITKSLDQDTEYLPPAELNALQTRRQAIEALEKSCKLSDKFWKIWQIEYLTSLREKHVLNVGRKKGSTQQPRIGTMVLICEATLPRHSWKMGIINDLVVNKNGVIREGIIRLPSRRLIRRPINLLVPLELEDDTIQEQDKKIDNAQVREENRSHSEDSSLCSTTHDVDTAHKEQSTSGSRYDLRPRRKLHYDEENIHQLGSIQGNAGLPTSLQILTVSLILCISTTQGTHDVKFSSINASCQFPVLAIGSTHPRKTACVEFGAGLERGHVSRLSGCFVKQIGLEPPDDELANCSRWTEIAKIRPPHTDGTKEISFVLTTGLLPSLSKRWNLLRFTTVWYLEARPAPQFLNCVGCRDLCVVQKFGNITKFHYWYKFLLKTVKGSRCYSSSCEPLLDFQYHNGLQEQQDDLSSKNWK